MSYSFKDYIDFVFDTNNYLTKEKFEKLDIFEDISSVDKNKILYNHFSDSDIWKIYNPESTIQMKGIIHCGDYIIFFLNERFILKILFNNASFKSLDSMEIDELVKGIIYFDESKNILSSYMIELPVSNLTDWNEDCDLYFKIKYGDLI